jgi:SAM-dependent methyltransferase
MEDGAGIPELGDAFGLALLDMVAGAPEPTVIERDDGFVGLDTTDYAAGLDDLAQWALDRAVGRVLDVGAGAGRASLCLQERGQDVLALDVSPGAILACRRQGVRAVYTGSVERAAAEATVGTFDSALLLGSNLSLLGSPAAATPFLSALGELLRPGGVIVGTCLDPYQTDKQVHLAYHEHNRLRGRMAGHLTIRVRYQRLATDWFDWLAMSPAELAEIAGSAGWQVAELRPGAVYAAVLARSSPAG